MLSSLLRLPPASSPAPASFSTPKARPMSVSPALIAMHGHPQRGGAGGAGVGHVVDGDAGLAQLLLDHLPDRQRAAHEVAGADDAHVLHGHAAVGQRALDRLATPGRRCPVSGCLPNFVMWMPRTHTSSDADAIVPNLPGVRNRSRLPRCRCRRCRSLRWPGGPSCPVVTCSGSGVTLIRLALHAGALAVDDGGHEGHGDARCGERHDGEGPHLAASSGRRPS